MRTKPTHTDFERHIPVLLHETIDNLALKPGAVVVDCNLGDGGHSEAIINHLGGNVIILGFDLDTDAITRSRTYIEQSLPQEYVKTLDKTLVPIQANFSAMDTELAKRGFETGSVDAILFDLGLSTYDLIGSGKGFTFRTDEPLHMTFGPVENHLFSAKDIVNEWAEEDIANVIFAYGEERLARKIARLIVESRTHKPFETSAQLAECVARAVPGKFHKTHPATKTFQALRIAVNNELEHLRTALNKAKSMLRKGGRMAVISYHSLEDRIVKQLFREWAENGEVSLIVKKPIVADENELHNNPRARSAKLRIIERI